MQWRSQLSVCCGEGFACVAEAHGNWLAAKMFATRAAMAAPPMKSEHSLMAARPEPAVCALFLAPVWRGRTRRGAANRMAGGLDALKAQVGVCSRQSKKARRFSLSGIFCGFRLRVLSFHFYELQKLPAFGLEKPRDGTLMDRDQS